MDPLNPTMLPGASSSASMLPTQPSPATGNVAGLQRPPMLPGLNFPPGLHPGMPPVPPMGMPPMMGPNIMPAPHMPLGVARPPLIVPGWQQPPPSVAHAPLGGSAAGPPAANIAPALPSVMDLHPGDRFVSTVFVGSISERAPDALIRQLLMKCGKMNNWKRVQGTSGRLQAFGFCEYADPESTLRALRLLNKFRLGSKMLTVKLDSKSRKDLQKYLVRKKKKKTGMTHEDARIEADKEVDSGSMGDDLTEELDDATKESDQKVKDVLETLIRENSGVFDGDEDAELKSNVTEAMISMARQTGKIGPDESMNMDDIDEDVRDRVSDEIKKFRMNYKKSEADRLKKTGRDKPSDESVSNNEEKARCSKDTPSKTATSKDTPSKTATSSGGGEERERDKSPRERRGRREDRTSRDRDEKRGRSRRSQSGSRRRVSRSRSRDRRRTKSRSRSRDRDQNRDRDYDRGRGDRDRGDRDRGERDKEEEMEQLRMERRKKERQVAYEERLRTWEARERRKLREYQKAEERESYKSRDLEKEKKKTDRYFADYNDDKDDCHYYKSGSMDSKLQDREREVEEDEKDRLREKQEMECINPAPVDDVPMETVVAPVAVAEPMDVGPPPMVEEVEEEPNDIYDQYVEPQQKPIPPLKEDTPPPQITAAFHSEYHLKSEEESKPKLAFSLGSRPAPAVPTTAVGTATAATTSTTDGAQAQPPKTKGMSMFGGEEDEDLDEGPRRKPSTLPPSALQEDTAASENNHTNPAPAAQRSEQKSFSSEERKRLMKTLVDSIPTSKGDLFAYQIKWEYLDRVLVEKRVCPWINKKITGYIGEEEPALTEFIINKVKQKCTPKSLLDEISMILDDEGEVFVVKLWRLLIYETEAKVMGITRAV